MNFNSYLNDFNNEFGDEFDDIKRDKKRSLDIDNIFKTELSLLNDIKDIKNKTQNLDIIYLEYNDLKQKLNNKIKSKKKELIVLNNEKESIELTTARKKLSYLIHEYKFYVSQTNSKEYINTINLLHTKIEYILKSSNKKLNDKYKKIKNKYSSIIAFIKSEQLSNNTSQCNNEWSILEKINWYNQKINELIEKQMIFNNYLFLLDDLYNELISYKFNNIKSYN